MATQSRRFLRAFAFASLALLAAAAVVLALPPVQLQLARALISRLDGITVEIGFLWAGPGGLDARRLHVVTNTAAIDIDAIEVDLAFWSSLTRLRLDVERATLRGVALERLANTQAEPDPASGSPAEPERTPFAGLRARARLPRALVVRELAASGSLSVETQDGVALTGPWTFGLSDLGAAAHAGATLTATLDARRDAEVLATVELTASAAADIDPDARVSSAALDANFASIDGATGVDASLAVDLAADERYVLDIDGANGADLVAIDGRFAPNDGLDLSWTVNIPPGVVATFARGRSVADLSATSTGVARFDPTGRRLELESSARAEGRGWEAFDPRLGAWGALGLDAELRGAIEPGTAEAQALSIRIDSAARAELLRIELLQPLRFDTRSWLVDPETPSEPALRIAASDLPLHWLSRISPAAQIRAGALSGAVDIVRDAPNRTALAVTEPIRVLGVELDPVGNVSLPTFDVELRPRASLEAGALDAEIERLSLTASTGLAIEFRGHGRTSRDAWPVAELDGEVTAHIPALERIVPELDQLRAATQLQLDFRTLLLTIRTASASAHAADGRQLAAADLSGQQPLRVALPLFEPDWDTADPQSLTLQLERMPIEWLSPYIPELELRGGELSSRLTASAGLGRGLSLESAEPLVIADVLPVYRGRPLRQTLTITARPRLLLSNAETRFELEALRIRTAGADELSGEISVAAARGEHRIAVSVSLDGTFPTLVTRSGTQLGTMRLRQQGELDSSRHRIRLDEFSIALTDGTGSEFLELESLRPFELATQPFGVTVDGGSTEILHAVVTPLRLERLVPRILGFDLEGVLPQGELVGRVEPDGGIVLAADEPLVFRDVTVRWDDAVLLDRVTASTRYEVVYSAEGVEVRSVDLTATDADDNLLVHTTSEVVAPLRDARLVDRARISIDANLTPLAAQPILAGLPRFTAGALQGALTMTNGEDTTIAVEAGLTGAEAEGFGALPDVDLRLDAAGIRGDRVRLTAPLRIASREHGQSDLELGGTLTRRTGNALDFDARLAGERLVVADARRLLALLEGANGPPTPAAPRADDAEPAGPLGLRPISSERRTAIAKLRAQRDDRPIWSDRFSGHATVAVARVSFPSVEVENLTGALELTPQRATLSNLSASLLGAELDANAAVQFDAARAEPYAFDFAANVATLDLGRLFEVVAPDEAPTVEGRFDFTSTLSGTGLNPLDLGLSALGEIRLTGRDGIFRGLAASAGTGSTAARVIGTLTFSRELRAVGRLLDGLGEIRFSEANLALGRAAADRLTLEQLEIVSPQLELDATGSLALAPQRPLLLSPLDLSAKLAASGDVAVLFDGMGLLEAQTNEAGYRALTRPVAIAGTAAEPDATAFWELLAEGADNARGAFGVGLRAINRRLEESR